MKKILMGTLGMAMAVSSFAGEYQDASKVNVPVQAKVLLGDVDPVTGIKVTGELGFGDLRPSLNPDGNPDSGALKKSLQVVKVENGVETPLNIGEYGYKAISANWTWDDAVAGDYVVTDGRIDEIFDVFHSAGSPTGEEIGDRNHNQFPYALRTQAQGGTIDVWFSGDVNSSLAGKTYDVKADVFVALPEAFNK